MPGRRRMGRGRRQRVMNFLKPCLLFLLQRNEAYGYSLLDELDQYGFDRQQIDPSLVYRALRDLEECGWVTSHWGEESQGPRRRIYQILPAGEEHLVDVMRELRRSRDEIDRLLAAYEDHLRSAGQA